MIVATKIINSKTVSDETLAVLDKPDGEEYVEVVFHDGTFVALNEEELRNAAALAEKGCLS
jgi:argininosuccinate synthase